VKRCFLRRCVRVEIRDSFIKDIKKTTRENKQKIEEVFHEFKAVNTLAELKNVKKLKGHKHFYRIRIGDYRLGFAFENDTIILLHFLHRKDIYRFFP
jgi:mRNA interferase RelE/StbE